MRWTRCLSRTKPPRLISDETKRIPSEVSRPRLDRLCCRSIRKLRHRTFEVHGDTLTGSLPICKRSRSRKPINSHGRPCKKEMRGARRSCCPCQILAAHRVPTIRRRERETMPLIKLVARGCSPRRLSIEMGSPRVRAKATCARRLRRDTSGRRGCPPAKRNLPTNTLILRPSSNSSDRTETSLIYLQALLRPRSTSS